MSIMWHLVEYCWQTGITQDDVSSYSDWCRMYSRCFFLCWVCVIEEWMNNAVSVASTVNKKWFVCASNTFVNTITLRLTTRYKGRQKCGLNTQRWLSYTLSWLVEFVSDFIIHHHFCHAPLGVCSAKRRHQSPECTILSHVNRFIRGEAAGFQDLLDAIHPHSMRVSWWSPSVLQGGCC